MFGRSSRRISCREFEPGVLRIVDPIGCEQAGIEAGVNNEWYDPARVRNDSN